MSNRPSVRYARWVYGNRALWSSRRRTTFSIFLIVAILAVQTYLLLSNASGWVMWLVAAIAVVIWSAVGRMWLNRDLADAHMDVEIRALLDHHA